MKAAQTLKLALAMSAAATLNFTLSAQGLDPRKTEPASASSSRWEVIASQAEATPGELSRVYLQFKPGQKAAARDLVRTVGGQIHYEFDRLDTVALTVPTAALKGIRENPNVVLVESDPPRYLLGCELSPQQVPPGVGMVQALGPANPGFTGGGVKIGVIDSGVFAGHPDLAGVEMAGQPADWDVDGLGHGTHVCGTIAAQQNSLGVVGVSPGVSIHMVKVFGADGSWTYSSTLLDAALACEAAGCRIISMSLGGGYSAVEDRGFQLLYEHGLLLVAAAGNGGNGGTIYPAGYASVISAAAIDDQMARASFSQTNADVELAGPGVNVLSTVPYCEQNSLTIGTASYAANHIDLSGRGVVTAPIVDGGSGLTTDPHWRGKIVLVERGVTNFITKVTNVQKSGGVACVIYNNMSGGFSGTLGSGNWSRIPAIAISQEDGRLIKSTSLGQNSTVSSARYEGVEGYAYYNGTSMATPHVSAAAALAWSANSDQPNTIIRAALRASALDLGDAGRDYSFGFGLVQAGGAIAALQTNLAPVLSIPPELIISKVSSEVTNPKRGIFQITWVTSVPATSQVTFDGQSDVFTNNNYVVNHSMAFGGPKGAVAKYYVTSTDAYGNTVTSGPHYHQN